MTYAFAKDSRACAACVSWGGERTLAAENTLVEVRRYSVEGECRTAASVDYRRVTKSYHTCERWAALPLLKAHGARPSRTPGPAAAMAGLKGARPPAETAAAPEPGVSASPLAVDYAPQSVRTLLALWTRARDVDRRPPAGSAITIAAVREMVPRLAVLTPKDGTFVYRACGRAIRRQLGLQPLATPLAAAHGKEAAARLEADLAACLAAGEPRLQSIEDDTSPGGGRYVELLLPLAGEDGAPASVLAYRHLAGG